MGLFDDLPSAKRPAEAAPPAPDPEPKRAKTEPAPAPAFAPAPADHVAALERIATHIVNPAKFKKAAALAAGQPRASQAVRRSGGCQCRRRRASGHKPLPAHHSDGFRASGRRISGGRNGPERCRGAEWSEERIARLTRLIGTLKTRCDGADEGTEEEDAAGAAEGGIEGITARRASPGRLLRCCTVVGRLLQPGRSAGATPGLLT